jgi:hypothetical protein
LTCGELDHFTGVPSADDRAVLEVLKADCEEGEKPIADTL